MLDQDTQREVRTVFIGVFGASSCVCDLVDLRRLGTWVTARAAIFTVIIGGFLIFLATLCCFV